MTCESPERVWNEYDVDCPSVSLNYSGNLLNIYTLNAIDIDFSEVEDKRFLNHSGVELLNHAHGDYKVIFDDTTRQPSRGTFENVSTIRKDKGKPY